MTNLAIMLVVSFVLILDGIILFVALPRIVKSAWDPIAKRFPPVEPEPVAVRREFQSFSIGLLNLGWSLHVAVDEGHLHLFPALVPRLWGMAPVSVPWSEVRDGGPAPFRQRRVRIGATGVRGPAWCLELASTGDGARRERA